MLQCQVAFCDRCDSFEAPCKQCTFKHGLVGGACLPCEQYK